MTATQPPTAPPAAVLAAAALATERPQAACLTQALLDSERAAKRQPQTLDAAALLGTWRLRFTAPNRPTYRSGKPVGKGFYVPGLAVATLAFSPGDGAIAPLTVQNQLRLGPIQLRFTGPAKVLPKKNLLAFDFLRVQLLLGSLSLIDRPLGGKSADPETFAAIPVAKLPFFSFFAVQGDYLAARGRGGGLALWARG